MALSRRDGAGLAAAGVLAGTRTEELLADLVDAGLDAPQARGLIEDMIRVRDKLTRQTGTPPPLEALLKAWSEHEASSAEGGHAEWPPEPGNGGNVPGASSILAGGQAVWPGASSILAGGGTPWPLEPGDQAFSHCPAPTVEDTVIPYSAAKQFWNLFRVALLGMVVGLAIFYWRWLEHRINVQFALVAAVCAGLLLVSPLVLLYHLWRRRRLVIGAQSLQLLEREATVLIRVPYRNVARIGTARRKRGGRSLAIVLFDRRDPDTFWRGWDDGRHLGCDIVLDLVNFQEPSEVIAERILTQIRRALGPPSPG
jgi:hypothetical protein